jgi:hypothetical protein
VADDRDGNRIIDGVQQSDGSDTVGNAREHRGFLRYEDYRFINLFRELADRHAGA